jgi:dihydrofolate reductase
MINAIFACDEEWGIGKNGQLPWPHNSSDLKWFKQLTENSTVIMGRKTWESLPIQPLPNRKNIVVSSTQLENVQTISIDSVEKYCMFSSAPIWIIGGSQLVEYCLNIIDSIYISNISEKYDCDIFLPKNKILEKFYAIKNEKINDLNITQWVNKFK